MLKAPFVKKASVSSTISSSASVACAVRDIESGFWLWISDRVTSPVLGFGCCMGLAWVFDAFSSILRFWAEWSFACRAVVIFGVCCGCCVCDSVGALFESSGFCFSEDLAMPILPILGRNPLEVFFVLGDCLCAGRVSGSESGFLNLWDWMRWLFYSCGCSVWWIVLVPVVWHVVVVGCLASELSWDEMKWTDFSVLCPTIYAVPARLVSGCTSLWKGWHVDKTVSCWGLVLTISIQIGTQFKLVPWSRDRFLLHCDNTRENSFEFVVTLIIAQRWIFAGINVDFSVVSWCHIDVFLHNLQNSSGWKDYFWLLLVDRGGDRWWERKPVIWAVDSYEICLVFCNILCW